MLTDAQIDRYSRQIVLPEIGGSGQLRLLSSRLVVISGLGELEPALSYLVGAGIGTIDIHCAADIQERRRVRTRMRDLNSQVRIIWGTQLGQVRKGVQPASEALLLLSARSKASNSGEMQCLDDAEESNRLAPHGLRARYLRLPPLPTVAAHLAEPLEMAVIASRPPCLACIGGYYLEPTGARVTDWELVAMMAVTEVLKILVGISPAGGCVMRFLGSGAKVTNPKPRSDCTICGS
jgi:hypothetical protein